MYCSAARAAESETAMRWSMRRARTPQSAFPSGYQPSRSPAEWQVATSGQGAVASAKGERTGASGSWTCTTSKSCSAQIRFMRSIALGLRMMLGSEAFAGTITERPTGST